MPHVLYDLREHGLNGYVENINLRLRQLSPNYIKRYGLIGSPNWWTMFNTGRISKTVHSGVVTHVGLCRDEFNEEHDVVRIETDRRDIEYDREDFWLDPKVKLGAWISIEQVKVITTTQDGPLTEIVDVRILLLD
ncbi:MAG: hypothetical protein LLG01_12680 [Planctomycetaceae bacterium]|nr:hypothetical protein [Planctomycetaceae bacterium]